MINLRIDKVSYKVKPNGYEMAKISNRLSDMNAKEISFEEFSSLVGKQGRSFCVSDFYGKRIKENFKSQQVFALDFDDGITYSEVSMRAESYGLPIALAYETFSSVNENRFRIVFINAFWITDIRVSEIIVDALMRIFPECDKACRDVSRIFLGGKKIIYASEKYMSLSNLMMEFQRLLKDKYGEKHYKKHVENFTVKHNLERCGGFAYIGGNQSEDNFKFIENDTEYYLNFNFNKPTNRKANKDKIRYFNFDKLCEKCKLYNEFLNDKRWLYHEELFGLASNLNNIEGGRKRFLEIIEESSYESYRQKDWRYCFTYMTAQEYMPQACEKFCPYADECNHAANIVLTGKTERNTVVKLKEKEYCTLDEAVAELQEKLDIAINSKKNQINIIKAQTAIGKTHCYVNLIKNSDKKFIVAVPTNILKEEVYNRLKYAGVEGIVKTASISTLEQRDDEIGQKIKEFNSLGAYNDLVDYLKKEAKDDKEYLLDYIKPLEQYGTEDVRAIVTTHKKFLNAKEDFLCNYEIIIDEDILLSSVKNSVTVLKEDILKLKKYPKVKKLFDNIKTQKDKYILTESCDDYISYKTITKKNISSNVNAFIKATAMHIGDKYINCFVPPRFHKVKYTILSATADEDVYKLFFKERIINNMECKEAKYKGKLIQDCSRSFSRRDIDGDEELFDKIITENPNAKHIITFMKYKEQANNCMIHYGNTEGCDYMKGEDILVIGTPHYNEMVYKLFAKHLEIDVNIKMKFMEIEDECYKYWLHTYEEPSLRKIQLWLLKSELIQAVGRARLLRYDCTVKLYASIPLNQAEIE